jgi:hypothetical protein
MKVRVSSLDLVAGTQPINVPRCTLLESISLNKISLSDAEKCLIYAVSLIFIVIKLSSHNS